MAAPSHSLHLSGWADAMACDVRAATASISVSALSIQPPRSRTPGQWPSLWQALRDAAARGVRVRLYMPTSTPTHPATRFNQWAASHAAPYGIESRFISGPRLLHCKSLLVDDAVLWIGSGNFTSAAAHHNIEAYVRLEDRAAALQVQARWDMLA